MLILVQYEQSELPNPVKYVRDTEYESIGESIYLLNGCGPIGVCAMRHGVASAAQAQTDVITVQIDRPGAAIPSTLFGLFFEDINFGADGGIYPERVKNRSFEFPDPLMGWTQIDRGGSKGAIYILNRGSFDRAHNSHYVRITIEGESKGFGLMNEGFRGMGI